MLAPLVASTKHDLPLVVFIFPLNRRNDFVAFIEADYYCACGMLKNLRPGCFLISDQPLLDAGKLLSRLGVGGRQRLTMHHGYNRDFALRASVEDAAGITITTSARGTPIFVRRTPREAEPLKLAA